MKRTLGIRLDRRLAATVLVEDETIAFRECHYVSARPAAREGAFARYFEKLLTQLQPDLIAIYAPTRPDTLTDRLVALLTERAIGLDRAVIRVHRPDLFAAVAVQPAHTRRQLQDNLATLSAPLGSEAQHRRLPLDEAMTAALIGEIEYTLAQ